MVLHPRGLRVCVTQVSMVKDVGLLILPKPASPSSRRLHRYCALPEQPARAWGFRSPYLPAPNQFPPPASGAERFPHLSSAEVRAIPAH